MTPAVVMNVFYTGLGIARSLGRRGVQVIGLSAHRAHYGNFTRYAKIELCPDSRHEPELLAQYMVALGKRLGRKAVIFPTRDDDVLFLDRYRERLTPFFIYTIPDTETVRTCLDKWHTWEWAQKVAVNAPRCWMIESEADLQRMASEVTYPCVLKPVAAYQWRQARNWEIVGGRKAVAVDTPKQLVAEYATIAQAEKRVLVQEMVSGADDSLIVVACYLDRKSNWVAGFNTQKLVQIPEGFGTGCILQTADRPELFDRTRRLLQAIRFTGIAEVEYKWDTAANDFKLIEINPRAWDQHRLGASCGVDLIHIAYCEHAGLPLPVVVPQSTRCKWIADDAFFLAALRLFWFDRGQLRKWIKMASGNRVWAIWDARDPLPMFALIIRLALMILRVALQRAWGRITLQSGSKAPAYEGNLDKQKAV